MSGFLSTQGNQVVDSTGTPVKISGVNWFGMESSRFVPDGLHARNYKDMMDQMKGAGFNAIRLPFSDQLFASGSQPSGIDYGRNPDLAGLGSLQILDRIVSYAGQIGMRIILDHHRNSAGDGASENGLWYDGAYSEQDWIANWTSLAVRYRDNPTVIGADLHNEPHGAAAWGGGGANDWAAAAERAGNAILNVNPDWLIFVEGVETYAGQSYWWGGNLMGVQNRPVQLNTANKLVYSAHDYPNSIFAQPWFSDPGYPGNLPAKFDQMWGYIYRNGLAPVYIGEFGSRLVDPKDVAWLGAIKAYLSGDFDADGSRDIPSGSEGIGWTWWSWNPNSGDTGGILQDDWSTLDPTKVGQLGPLTWGGRFPGVYVGTAAGESLSGSAHSEVMHGLGGADTLDGGGGNDDIDGGPGPDVMLGGDGDDTFHVDHPGDVVTENAGEGYDTILAVSSFGLAAQTSVERLQAANRTSTVALALSGNDGANTIVGNAGANALRGLGGIDFLEGLAGDDTLDGGSGADTLLGGAGNDTYIIDSRDDRVIDDLGNGHDVVWTSVSFALAATSEVEELRAAGGASAMSLTGTVSGNLIVGTSQDDTLDGGGGGDTLIGGAGNDVYIVRNSRDVIQEATGGGHDTVLAESSFSLSDNLEVLKAMAGGAALSLTGNNLANEIVGNVGANVIVGLDGSDTLYGDGGNDQISGGSGDDWQYGGIGNDRLDGGPGNDRLYGDVGNDTLAGGDGHDLLYGGTGKNNLRGGNGDDKVHGGAHTDALYGDAGKDGLKGDAGNDILYGGLGNDTLSGGYGRDSFVFNTRLKHPTNVDRILDFNVPDDTMKLARSVFSRIEKKGTLDASAFSIGAAAHDDSDRIIYNNATGALFYDPDGIGATTPTRFAILKKKLPLTHADFLIV